MIRRPARYATQHLYDVRSSIVVGESPSIFIFLCVLCAAPGRAGAATAPASDPLSRRARPQCRAARRDRAESSGGYRQAQGRTRARRAGAHGVGAPAQASFRNRSRTLPTVWRGLEDHPKRGFPKLLNGVGPAQRIDSSKQVPQTRSGEELRLAFFGAI